TIAVVVLLNRAGLAVRIEFVLAVGRLVGEPWPQWVPFVQLSRLCPLLHVSDDSGRIAGVHQPLVGEGVLETQMNVHPTGSINVLWVESSQPCDPLIHLQRRRW